MVRCIIERLDLLKAKNIPATAVAGMFFFCTLASADNLQLATGLFEQEQWALCRRECRRALLAHKEPVARFQLLEALSAVRAGAEPASVAATLQSLAESSDDVETGALASYELGRLRWELDQPSAALDAFTGAFHATTNKDLFLRSACSLFLLFKDYPDLKQGREGLISQINTSRALWYGRLFAECARPGAGAPRAPHWVVRFYRSQVSPAIGNRCTLEPSCSEYFHQAGIRHGLKAVPMTADRFVREPAVNSDRKTTVVVDGQVRYSDPVEDHDFWMKR